MMILTLEKHTELLLYEWRGREREREKSKEKSSNRNRNTSSRPNFFLLLRFPPYSLSFFLLSVSRSLSSCHSDRPVTRVIKTNDRFPLHSPTHNFPFTPCSISILDVFVVGTAKKRTGNRIENISEKEWERERETEIQRKEWRERMREGERKSKCKSNVEKGGNRS